MITNKIEATERIETQINENYNKIKFQYENEYGSSQFDFLREEICLCILCGLNQSAITLTNHFFENFFKTMVQLKLGYQDDHFDLKNMYKDVIDKYDSKDLEVIINVACSNGIITKAQKETLKELKRKYRNPYSHSSKKEIFGEDKLVGFRVNPRSDENPFSEITEFETKYELGIHGLFQQIKAKKEALNYFIELDAIIRSTLSRFYNKSL